MSTIDTARRLLESWERDDLKTAGSVLSDDFVLTGPAPVPLNKGAYLTFQSVHNDGFADWNFHAKDFRAEGDVVTCTIHISAKHTKPYDVARLGIPIPPVAPNGVNPVWPEEYLTFRIKGDRITELNVKTSEGGGVVGTLAQLGVALK